MNGMYYTYVLESLKYGITYIGQTRDIEARIKAHNEGKSPYTRGRGPWKLIYFEELPSRSEAMKREKYFKSGHGREFLKSVYPK